MGYVLLPLLTGVLFANPALAEKTFTTEVSRAVLGKVVPVSSLKHKPEGATGIVFFTDGEKMYPVQESDKSRLLFLDQNLQNRPLRLTGRLTKGATLVVERVQTVKGTSVFDVDYWCPHCLLSATEPGPCRCCGGETVLRELAVK